MLENNFYPFGRDLDEKADTKIEDYEKDTLEDVEITVWPSKNGAEVCVFREDGWAASKMLIDMLRDNFTGDQCGEKEEIEMLEKLKLGIDEIIANLAAQNSDGC